MKPLSAPAVFLTCFDLTQPRFRGMRRLIEELAEKGEIIPLIWTGGVLPAAEFSASGSVLASGHGSPECARLGDGASRFLAPADLCLPDTALLYLLGCYQGLPELLREWEAGTGIAAGAAAGAEGETETLLSTLLLLHLLEEGPAALPGLFRQWVQANRLIRPFFEPARELYRCRGGEPLGVMDWLQGQVDLSPVAGFLELARRHPGYLTGLM